MRYAVVFLCLILLYIPSATSQETWNGLVVAPENRCSKYISKEYSYPQSVEPKIIKSYGNRIYGPYTGTYFDTRFETDIEHMVAKSEAHDSGMCSRTKREKRLFARDLLNLTLAGSRLNKHEKGVMTLQNGYQTRISVGLLIELYK